MKQHAPRRRWAARAIFAGMAALAMAGGIQVAAAAAPASAAQSTPATGAAHATAPRAWMHVSNLLSAYEHALSHVKLGKIGGITYRVGYHPKAAATKAPGSSCAEPNCALTYHGGPVQQTAHIYLLLWGPTWQTNAGEEASASYMKAFYEGLGVRPQDTWSAITSQYTDSSGGFPTFSGSQFMGVFNDTSTPPTGTSQAQFTAEADAFATAHGLTTNPLDDQVVIATQSGTCPAGFYASGCSGGTGYYCAYHSNDPASGVTFTNLPYLPDAGTGCGENFVNSGSAGTYDGFSIVGGHEYAETITDPYPTTGWYDPNDSISGGEIGDKCAWGGEIWGGNDPYGNVTLSTGSFAMQSLWSNATNSCVMSSARDQLSLTSPGDQSTADGTPVALQIKTMSSSGAKLAYTAAGLPAGLSISSTTGRIAGTPTTVGTSHVTVTAYDTTGALTSATFTWTVATCPPAQLLRNPGFETGTLAPWKAGPGVLQHSSREYRAHSGKWLALLHGRGIRRNDRLYQKVEIPAGCASAKFSFWLKIRSNDPRRKAYDTLKVEILSSSGEVLRLLHTYSNRNSASRYRHHVFTIDGYAGRKIIVKFIGRRTLRHHTTTFLIDGTALRVS